MKPVDVLRAMCCTVLLVISVSSAAWAGYWKFTGIQGIAHQVTPNGGAKAVFKSNSATYYHYNTDANMKLERQLVYTWSALPDKIYPGRKYTLSAEGKAIVRAAWVQSCADMGIYFREAFGAGGASIPDTSVASETGCTDSQKRVNIEYTMKEGSPDKNNSFHYGYIIFNFGLKTTTSEMYKYVYEWVADSSPSPSSTPQVSGSSSALSIDGAWSINNQPCQVIQSGDSLTFINENGQRSRGRFIRANAVVAIDWGNLEGRLGAYYKGQRMAATEARDAFGANVSEIKWGNGTVWRRPGNR